MSSDTRKRFPKAKWSDVAMFDPEDLELVTDPKHALYDKRVHLPVREELVLNIMEYGVLENILGAPEGTKMLVAAGRQRVKAAREANKRIKKAGGKPITVPVTLKHTKEEKRLVGIVVTENEHRVPDGPAEKAEKAARMRDRGANDEEIAVAFGVSASTVRNWTALQSAAPEVRKAVAEGTLPLTAGTKLSKLSAAKQAEAVKEMKAKGATKGKAAAQAAAEATGTKSTPTRPRKELERLRAALRGDLEEVEMPDVPVDTALDLLNWSLGEEPEGWITVLLESKHA